MLVQRAPQLLEELLVRVFGGRTRRRADLALSPRGILHDPSQRSLPPQLLLLREPSFHLAVRVVLAREVRPNYGNRQSDGDDAHVDHQYGNNSATGRGRI